MDDILDPKTLAEDLAEVHQIYSSFFAALNQSDWDKPVKGSLKEWNLHETIAHLVALNGDGLESIKHTLRGQPYTFVGLEDRYKFNAWNRKGIDDHLHLPWKELCAEALGILDEAALIARALRPDQAQLTAQMPIYNRPVSIAEALSIIIFHAGLAHAAQVAEPAGVPPLWMQHSPAFRHRMVGRVMRAFSLLYRLDFGGPLRDTIVFRIDGPDGGEWYVRLSPEAPTSGDGLIEHPGLVIYLRETAIFCQMLTGRINLPMGLITGAMKLRGDLRLFFRMSTLFSIDARPHDVTEKKHYPLPSTS
ncbi:MAG TPA: DinB family protein [Anaerolineales bacterium]|nr:DinB family protein [Anaerolineales bacterium]